MAYYIDMKEANIGEFKDRLSKYLSIVEKGEEVKICKRNIPIAHLVPYNQKKKMNQTKLGCGKGTVKIKADLTEPMIPVESWEMLK